MSAEVNWNPYAELLSADLSSEGSWELLFRAGQMLLCEEVFQDEGSRLYADQYLGEMFSIIEDRTDNGELTLRIRDLMYEAGTIMRCIYGDYDLLSGTQDVNPARFDTAVLTCNGIDEVRRSLAAAHMVQYKEF